MASAMIRCMAQVECGQPENLNKYQPTHVAAPMCCQQWLARANVAPGPVVPGKAPQPGGHKTRFLAKGAQSRARAALRSVPWHRVRRGITTATSGSNNSHVAVLFGWATPGIKKHVATRTRQQHGTCFSLDPSPQGASHRTRWS
jgi:hypothetical protein